MEFLHGPGPFRPEGLNHDQPVAARGRSTGWCPGLPTTEFKVATSPGYVPAHGGAARAKAQTRCEILATTTTEATAERP